MAVHPPPALAGPLAMWRPGLVAPDAGAIAYRLEKRWAVSPHRRELLFGGTREAALRTGAPTPRRPRRTEASHDVGLAEVFVRLLLSDPVRAARWVSESFLSSDGWGAGCPLPDAAIHLEAATTLIEFGGSYPRQKLLDFHLFCEIHGYAYEVW